MSEQAAGKLRTQGLHHLLDELRAYLESDKVVIQTRLDAPDSCGHSVHLEGPFFVAGFLDFLKSKGEDAEKLISELCLVMEISTYVRSGGTKVISYRLETGAYKRLLDYFDNLALELCYEVVDGKLQAPSEMTTSRLVQRLKEIDPEDESRVATAISEIDELLLALSRKLEEVSLKKLSAEEKES